MFRNGSFQSSTSVMYRNDVLVVSRISSSDRKAFNIYKNIFFTLIPYGYAVSLAESIITRDPSVILDENRENTKNRVMNIVTEKAERIVGKDVVRLVGQAKTIKGIFKPIYYGFKELKSPETNQERLERLVYQHLKNQYNMCRENIVNKSLLDCYRAGCSECNVVFMKKYVNITYSLFEKTYILHSEADYKRAEADIKNRRAAIDDMIRFYLNRL